MSRRLAVALSLALLAGCAPPDVRYSAAPAWLIPPPPALPGIPAAELSCLSDATYLKLVERDRARDAEARQLRALLEAR